MADLNSIEPEEIRLLPCKVVLRVNGTIVHIAPADYVTWDEAWERAVPRGRLRPVPPAQLDK